MAESIESLGLAAILKEMEEMVSNASRVPLSNKVLIDSESLLSCIDKIYAALPEELKQAQRMLENSDKLLESVEGQSKRIIAEAKEQAEEMTRSTTIYQEAAERANSMIEQAEGASAQLRHESLHYCDDVLYQLSENLERILGNINKNREDLRSFKFFDLDENAQ